MDRHNYILWLSGRDGVCGIIERVDSEPCVCCSRSTSRIPWSVAHLGREDLYLKPKTVLGCMQVVQSTDVILPDCGKTAASEMATGRVESASTAEQFFGEMDIGDGLGPEHRRMLVELIDQYSESFSQI